MGKNGKLIEKSSDIIGESEVLFKSRTTFMVESIQKIDHPLPERAMNGEEVIEIILKEK